MQGFGAHDLIEHDQQAHAECRAALVGSPPARRLVARPHEPKDHGVPSVIERELGEALHPDRTAAHGHPGVACRDLPSGHAHRLPQYKEARDLRNPEEAEAPLLVAVQEQAAVVTEGSAPAGEEVEVLAEAEAPQEP